MTVGGTSAGETASVIDLDDVSYPIESSVGPLFIEFYAPWCGHCKRLAPIWTEFGAAVNSRPNPAIRVARVDCVAQAGLCSEFGIQAYPTLQLTVNSKASEYSGGRTLEALEYYIQEATVRLEEDRAKKEAKVVIHDHLYQLTDGNFDLVTKSGVTLVKFYAPWCGHCKKLAPVWREVAEHIHGHVGEVAVQVGEIDCTVHKKTCADREIRGYPAILAFREGERIEKYAGDRSFADLEAFVKRVAGTKLTKVEIVHEDGVRQLTAENFNHMTARGLTFVKFYAPWCDHCKAMVADWQELGLRSYKGRSGDTLVAEIDCVKYKETCKTHRVEGYPTLILFKNGVELQKYTGQRSFTAFERFLLETEHRLRHDEL